MPSAIVALQQRRPEDRREPDREDEEREREQRRRSAADHRVDPAAVVAGDEPDRHARSPSRATSRRRRPDRCPRAPDEPREDVAAELVGAEQVLARRLGEQRVEVGRRGRVRRDPRREDRDEDERRSTTTSPMTAIGRRRNRLRSSRRRRARGESVGGGVLDVAHDGAPDDPDPRVQQRVEEVDHQVDDDVAGGRDEHDALDQRVVTLVDGVDRQPAEAGDDEDRLRDRRPRR